MAEKPMTVEEFDKLGIVSVGVNQLEAAEIRAALEERELLRELLREFWEKLDVQLAAVRRAKGEESGG